MQSLIWAGAVMSVAGLAGLIWCILTVWRAKRAGLSDDELRESVRRVLPLNMGALFLSVLGLILIVIGVTFG